MIEIREKVQGGEASTTLTLPFEERKRTRRRVELSTGEVAVLLTPRGSLLRGGDVLLLSDGRRVRVVAAPELVSTVHASEPRALARVAYHLGNRHVALEVGEGFVRYLHDHVLDGMVRELGLAVVVERAPFEPEAGAYAGGHGHGHGHGHGGESVHVHVHVHEGEAEGHGHGGEAEGHGHGHVRRVVIGEGGGERSEIGDKP